MDKALMMKKRGGGSGLPSGLPIDISTDAEMNNVQTSENIGKIYKFTGQSSIYNNDSLYIIGENIEIKCLFPEPDYLCFTAEESGSTIKVCTNRDFVRTPMLEYSTNRRDWNEIEFDVTLITLTNVGDCVYLRGNNDTLCEYTSYSTESHTYFEMTGTIAASGNIMTLLDKYANNNVVPDYAFYMLFFDCSSLVSAPELPATTLGEECYSDMFGYTSITVAPELPATTLADYCYMCMFEGCESLITPPELPATSLAKGCYDTMFLDCISLTEASELPATTLTEGCYWAMFWGCTSLQEAPELPATTLAKDCYKYMFPECEFLTPPELPATTLAESCYECMFKDCALLTEAPELPATILSTNCYNGMFSGCTSLTTAPELPASTLESRCYYSMFEGCTSLNYIKLHYGQELSDLYFDDWVKDINTTGDFYYNGTTTDYGDSAIPTGWTVHTF